MQARIVAIILCSFAGAVSAQVGTSTGLLDADSATEAELRSGDDDDLGEGQADFVGGHKTIPSWDEAIGVIIAKNMEARVKDPRGPERRSGGGGGRGRGRRDNHRH